MSAAEPRRAPAAKIASLIYVCEQKRAFLLVPARNALRRNAKIGAAASDSIYAFAGAVISTAGADARSDA